MANEMTHETIEVRLEGELYQLVANLANQADVPIELLAKIGLAKEVSPDEPLRQLGQARAEAKEAKTQLADINNQLEQAKAHLQAIVDSVDAVEVDRYCYCDQCKALRAAEEFLKS